MRRAAAIARVRASLGLPPREGDALRRPASPWLNLAPTHEAIEPTRDDLGPHTAFVGPCTSGRTSADGFPWERLDPAACKVYVSLGTVFNRRPAVFRTILDGLDAAGVQPIVSGGGSYDALLRGRLPERTLLFRSVPQIALLPRVDLVIGHGGNKSTNETLAAGKPLLVIPMGGEQGDNAARVEHLGAGLRLDLACLSAEQVREKVDRLRREPRFGARARELAARLAETDGALVAARLVEAVARTKQPWSRPEGAPLTITPARLSDLEKHAGRHLA